MKVLSVFWKNLRTVSRNPNYFLILVVCPIALIFIASLTLNSIDFSNLRIGVVDSSGTMNENERPFDLGESFAGSITFYEDLPRCIYDLTRAEVNACFFIVQEEGGRRIDVYIDNTKQIVEYYARQFLLENVLKEQNAIFERTADMLQSNITLFSTALVDAKNELKNAEKELDSQEQMIVGYQQRLAEVRKDFNSAHAALHSLESEIGLLEASISGGEELNDSSMDIFLIRKQNFETQVRNLRKLSFFQQPIPPVVEVNESLNDIGGTLDQIEQAIVLAKTLKNNSGEAREMIKEYRDIMQKVDEMDKTLSNFEQDLEKSRAGIQLSKERIALFLSKVLQGEKELREVYNQIDPKNKNYKLVFKGAFSLSDDPVFLSFPLLVAMIITFSSIVLTNMFVLREVNQPSYLRDIIAPTWRITFILGDYLVNVFFIGIQIGALYLAGLYGFGYEGLAYSGIYFISLFLGASVFILLGMCISYFIRSEGISTIISLFSVLVFLVMSDVLAPVTLASPIMRFIIELNPFFVLKQILSNTLLLGQSYVENQMFLLRLIVYCGIGFVVAYFARRFSEREALE
jgi:ABC-type transport system involved in multi-copper enzyme maturation permease subunit